MHFRFEGRPNAVPDNYGDNARYEVHIALLLHVEVFRDHIYFMAMSSVIDSRWSVVTGNYLQGLGPGLCLETSRLLIPHSCEYSGMRSFRLRLYNRCSWCRVVKEPKSIHPSNICMICVFRVAETSFRFTLRHFCLLESNGPNHSGSNIRYDPLPFIRGTGSKGIKEVNKEVGSASPIRKYVYECAHFSDWPNCNFKLPFVHL